jgi:hypothetical protein
MEKLKYLTKVNEQVQAPTALSPAAELPVPNEQRVGPKLILKM